MNEDIIVYDIETKETFQDIGTRDPRKLHISVIGMFSFKENAFHSYEEHELPEFWRRLEQCDMIVGFNNKGFDDQVCSAYFPEINKVFSFDILEEIHKNLGFRVKLDNIAHATLNTGKSGDGLKAIKLYREGKMDELKSYCLDDVKITRDVFNYGQQHGELWYEDLQGKKKVLVDFFPAIERSESLNLSLF